MCFGIAADCMPGERPVSRCSEKGELLLAIPCLELDLLPTHRVSTTRHGAVQARAERADFQTRVFPPLRSGKTLMPKVGGTEASAMLRGIAPVKDPLASL
jgi:hypothetical protein